MAYFVKNQKGQFYCVGDMWANIETDKLWFAKLEQAKQIADRHYGMVISSDGKVVKSYLPKKKTKYFVLRVEFTRTDGYVTTYLGMFYDVKGTGSKYCFVSWYSRTYFDSVTKARNALGQVTKSDNSKYHIIPIEVEE